MHTIQWLNFTKFVIQSPGPLPMDESVEVLFADKIIVVIVSTYSSVPEHM